MATPFRLRLAGSIRIAALAIALACAVFAGAQTPNVEPFLGKPRAVPQPKDAPDLPPPPAAIVRPLPVPAQFANPPEPEVPPVPPLEIKLPPLNVPALPAMPPPSPDGYGPVPDIAPLPLLESKLPPLIAPPLPPLAAPLPSPEASPARLVGLKVSLPPELVTAPVVQDDPPPSILPPPRVKEPLPKDNKGVVADEDVLIGISTGEPSREAIFRMETENELRERIQRENPHWKNLKLQDPKSQNPVAFPPQRQWLFHPARTEPNRFAYGRLWWEQTGPERYGRDLGPASPFIQAAWFNYSLWSLPVRFIAAPYCVETNEGRPLPGDPQPAWDRGFPYRTWRETP